MTVTIVKGITAVQDESGANFTGGVITNSTIDSTPIGATAPSTGSFTTVSAQTGVFAGDVAVSGKVTVGQAVSAASFHANTVVSAGTDLNAAANIVAGARTVVVSGDSGNITATGKVDITGAVSAASGHFAGTVSAAAFSPSSTSGIIGTTTNDNAATGSVGEFTQSIVLQGAASGLSTATAKTVTFVVLQAGDWDVTGTVKFTGNTTTTLTYSGGSISTLPNSVQDSPAGYTINFTNGATVFLTTNPISYSLSPVRFSVNTSSNAYLNAVASFGVSVCSAYGGIQARRIR